MIALKSGVGEALASPGRHDRLRARDAALAGVELDRAMTVDIGTGLGKVEGGSMGGAGRYDAMRNGLISRKIADIQRPAHSEGQ